MSFIKYLLVDCIVGTELEGRWAGRLYYGGLGRCCRGSIRGGRQVHVIPMHCLAVCGVPLGWLVPSVEFPVDGDVVADSVGGVVVGSDDWAGCGLGSSVGSSVWRGVSMPSKTF